MVAWSVCYVLHMLVYRVSNIFLLFIFLERAAILGLKQILYLLNYFFMVVMTHDYSVRVLRSH